MATAELSMVNWAVPWFVTRRTLAPSPASWALVKWTFMAFHSHGGIPEMVGLFHGKLRKWMIWGYSYFRKPSFHDISACWKGQIYHFFKAGGMMARTTREIPVILLATCTSHLTIAVAILVGGLVAIWIIFPEILGMSSSQLTNSYFSGRGG